MIPVVPKPEPADFGLKVRDRGMSWLEKNGLPAQGPLPEGSKPKPYWRECIDDPMHREMRARHFLWCKQGQIPPDFLERMSPFVYLEARRQGLLP
jgi:hypothetical protein